MKTLYKSVIYGLNCDADLQFRPYFENISALVLESDPANLSPVTRTLNFT